MGYTVNPDGTVTRHKKPTGPNRKKDDSGNLKRKKDDSGNEGCGWMILWIVCIAIIVIIFVKSNTSTSNNIVPIEIQNSSLPSNNNEEPKKEELVSPKPELRVSEKNLYYGYEEWEDEIEVYSTSSWYIDTYPDYWVLVEVQGTKIYLTVLENQEEDSRQDYFIIKNEEGCKQRVNIYQE